jgi:hypothetical protein
VPLGRTNVYFSFGGEARLNMNSTASPVFNQQPADDNGFLLQRYPASTLTFTPLLTSASSDNCKVRLKIFATADRDRRTGTTWIFIKPFRRALASGG